LLDLLRLLDGDQDLEGVLLDLLFLVGGFGYAVSGSPYPGFASPNFNFCKEIALRHEDLQGAPLLILENKQVSQIGIYIRYIIQYFMVPEIALRHEDLQGAPLLILENKQDLAEALSAEEIARFLDLKRLDKRAYTFEVVSAHDGPNVT
jgi:signal recognition particle receptor subunit beta